LIAACTAAFAQLHSDTISITATGQTALPQPDQVTVSVSVYAGSELGFEQVAKILAGIAVTELNLISVERPTTRVCARECSPVTLWRFGLTEPLSKLNETLRALARIETAQPSGVENSYSVSSSVSSAATQECAYPILISQARRHAGNIAAAAGLRVGAIVAMSDGTGAAQAESSAVPTAAFRTGDFSSARWFSPPPVATPGCTAVVEFQLLR
jgi:hypothetical protein